MLTAVAPASGPGKSSGRIEKPLCLDYFFLGDRQFQGQPIYCFSLHG